MVQLLHSLAISRHGSIGAIGGIDTERLRQKIGQRIGIICDHPHHSKVVLGYRQLHSGDLALALKFYL